MTILSAEQRERALEVMREYLTAPKNSDGRTPMEGGTELDQGRAKIIDGQQKPLLDEFLAGRVPLAEFKSQVDGINKRQEYWGFKGIKGQMFFNMVFNVADDTAECDEQLKEALAMPIK